MVIWAAPVPQAHGAEAQAAEGEEDEDEEPFHDASGDRRPECGRARSKNAVLFMGVIVDDRQTAVVVLKDRMRVIRKIYAPASPGRDRQAETSGRDRQAETPGRERQAETPERERQAENARTGTRDRSVRPA
ncbi:MAG TPA: hypothetical protein VN800_04940 [Candidatus Acidoferrales bacterium]|nr:hypothetical protein [Candidatus Acidoferrales bacterium]